MEDAEPVLNIDGNLKICYYDFDRWHCIVSVLRRTRLTRQIIAQFAITIN